MLGPIDAKYLGIADIKGYEVTILVIVAAFVIYLGVFPNGLLSISEASVGQLLQQVKF